MFSSSEWFVCLQIFKKNKPTVFYGITVLHLPANSPCNLVEKNELNTQILKELTMLSQ